MNLNKFIISRLSRFEWVFDINDGIIRIGDRERLNKTLNLRTEINRMSLFSPGIDMPIADHGGAIVDCYFGNVYTDLPQPGSAVYGETHAFLKQPSDDFADLGFLRVPFKRIPRMGVRSRSDIEKVINLFGRIYGADKLLFRGQTSEHYLKRSTLATELFYGTSLVLEPSLLPSSSRRSPSIEDCMPEWMMWVQLCQLANINKLRGHFAGLKQSVYEQLAREALDAWRLTKSYFFCLSLAQHYGLPSRGLDVTNDLATAIFFALHEFKITAPGFCSAQRVSTNSQPVIYILLREGTREFSFEECTPFLFKSGRPKQQSAWFMSTGWGLQQNSAAEQILVAMYLDPMADYSELPAVTNLFPGPELDSVASFLSSVRSHSSEVLKQVLQDFYWVNSS